MDFRESIASFSERIRSISNSVKTEEATKQHLILPFIHLLGYDIFNPEELIPETDCDLDKPKGEKCDYAISLGGEICILIECKKRGESLTLHAAQLGSYFAATRSVTLGILTNGIEYRFYTDTERVNIMDENPFFTAFLNDFSSLDINTLSLFRKSEFNGESLREKASTMKYCSGVRNLLRSELESPSDDFVRHFAKQVYTGKLRQNVVEDFRVLIMDEIKNRDNEAFEKKIKDSAVIANDAENCDESSGESRIVTTETELLGYNIVRAIVADVLPVERVGYLDRVDYFKVIVDNRYRQAICNLRFNNEDRMRIEFAAGPKRGQFQNIGSVEDLYLYRDDLREIAKLYL